MATVWVCPKCGYSSYNPTHTSGYCPKCEKELLIADRVPDGTPDSNGKASL